MSLWDKRTVAPVYCQGDGVEGQVRLVETVSMRLLPLDCAGRLTGNIVNAAVNTFDFVYDPV